MSIYHDPIRGVTIEEMSWRGKPTGRYFAHRPIRTSDHVIFHQLFEDDDDLERHAPFAAFLAGGGKFVLEAHPSEGPDEDAWHVFVRREGEEKRHFACVVVSPAHIARAIAAPGSCFYESSSVQGGSIKQEGAQLDIVQAFLAWVARVHPDSASVDVSRLFLWKDGALAES